MSHPALRIGIVALMSASAWAQAPTSITSVMIPESVGGVPGSFSLAENQPPLLWGPSLIASPDARASTLVYSEDFENMAWGIPSAYGWIGGEIVVAPTAAFGQRSIWAQSDFSSSGAGYTFLSTPGAAIYGTVTAQVYISVDDGVEKTFETAWRPSPTSAGVINTRIDFQPGGAVLALQVDAAGNGVFAPTSGTWTTGAVMTVDVQVAPSGALNVYLDGSLIFTGLDVSMVTGIGPGGFNLLRVVAWAASPTNQIYMDNIAVQASAGPADLDGDGHVGSADLATILGTWGSCPPAPTPCAADLDGDGVVGSADLAIMLGSWG